MTYYFATVNHPSGKTIMFGPYVRGRDLEVELETYESAYHGFGRPDGSPRLTITRMQTEDHILGQHGRDWYHSEVLQGRRNGS